MKLARTALFLAAALCSPAIAQNLDNSGNSKLNGSYYFRELLFTSSDAIAAYGNITFSNGTFTITAQLIDANAGAQQAYNTSGSYTISASGFGFIQNPLNENQTPVYGLVGANGVFVGSSSESGDYDLFIAAPVSSQSLSTLQGSYSLAYMDPTGALTGQIPFDALVQMSPNGAGLLGTVNLNINAGASGSTTQSISGVKYIVSNNAFNLEFPSSNNSQNLIQGSTYLYSTPDGNFVFGGSPLNFDMFVGVRTGSPNPFGGLYYQAGFDLDTSGGSADTFYGSFNAVNGIILGHQRLQEGGAAAIGFTYNNSYPTGTTGNYTDSSTNTQFIAGNGGVEIGLGVGSVLTVSASLPSPGFNGSGAYISPVGIVNSGSYAPFTAGVSPGEYITIFGSNIGPSSLQVASSVPLPTKLGGVQVLINNIAAPILYVSSTQLSVVTPNEINPGAVAQIQVVNGSTTSNLVTELVNQTTPGVYTLTQNGIGYGATIHQDGSTVSPSSPAQIGETVSVFLTGLGAVSTTVPDGAAAPGAADGAINTIGVLVGGIQASVQYAGLAPGFVALYQLNVTIPTGVTTGDNYLDISGPDSYSSEALISVGSGGSAVIANTARSHAKPHTRASGFPLPGRSIPTARVKPL